MHNKNEKTMSSVALHYKYLVSNNLLSPGHNIIKCQY